MKKLIIIDSNAVIHRAFHALPPLTTKKGEIVNAVYGFLLIFFRIVKDFNPDYIIAAFDVKGKTIRHEEYKEYKANRPKTPDDISSQIPKVKEVLNLFKIKILEKQGYEADDVVGTISKLVLKDKIETIIITGDLDLLQLVNKSTKSYTLRRGVKDAVLYDEEAVKEKYQGLTPDQLADFRGLRGDPSDNIPGVLGVGEKTAITLLNEFSSIENLYEKLDKSSIKDSLKNKLEKGKQQAFLSKKLAEIRYDVPIDFLLEDCRWGEYDKEKIVQVFESYGFNTLIQRVLKLGNENDTKEVVKSNLSLW